MRLLAKAARGFRDQLDVSTRAGRGQSCGAPCVSQMQFCWIGKRCVATEVEA